MLSKEMGLLFRRWIVWKKRLMGLVTEEETYLLDKVMLDFHSIEEGAFASLFVPDS